MREALIALGILIVLGIGLDCLRRMRNARRDSIQMQLNMSRGIDGDGLDDDFGSELPGGGARVAERQGGAERKAPVRNRPVRKAPEAEEPYPSSEPTMKGIPALSDEQIEEHRAELDLEQPVPMLMDQDEDGRQEPGFGVPVQPAKDSARDPLMGGESAVLSKPRVVPRDQALKDEELTEVIVMNVMSRSTGFHGAELLESLLECGMRFGSMNIFHHYRDDKGDGPVLYSMANIVKPGTFDLNNMDSFRTPGVSFFLQLPMENEKLSAIDAFEKMLHTAKTLVDRLDGELRDENRSVMTKQTIEHCRQRIRDFALHKLTKSGKFSANN